MANAPRRTKSFGYGNRSNAPREQNLNLMVELVGKINRAPGGGTLGTPWTEELEKAGKPFDNARVRILSDIPRFDLKKGDEVDLLMPLPKAYQDGSKEFRGRNLAKLDVSVSGGEPMRSGAVFGIQNVWMKGGRLFAHFGAGGPNAPALEFGSAAVEPDVMATVLAPRKREDGTEYQQVLFIKTNQATSVTSGDDILAAYEAAFPDGADIRNGNPGFALFARAKPPEGLDEAGLQEFYDNPQNRVALRQAVYAEKPEGADRYAFPSAFSVIEKFVERDDATAKSLFEKIEDPNWDVQFAPMMTVGQSPNRLPSKSERGVDYSADYIGYEESEEDPEVMEPWDPIFTPSSIAVMRIATFYDKDGNEVKCTPSGNILDDEGCKTAEKASSHVFGNAFSTYQNPIERGSPTGYYLSDIPTAGMPEGHLAAVTREGERIKQNGVKARRAAFAERQANEASPEGTAPKP